MYIYSYSIKILYYLLINDMPEEKYIYVSIIPTKASFLLILVIISSYFPDYAMLDL